MADDKINSVIDEAKIQKQFDKLFNLLVQAIGAIKEVNNAAKGMNFGSGFKEAAEALKNARSFTDQYKQAKAEATRQESLLTQELIKSKTALAAFTLAQKQAAAEAKAAKAAIVGEAGSILDLRNKLKDMTAQWDKLGPAARKSNQQLLSSIKSVRDELGKLEADTGRSQRNVGNYPKQIVGGATSLASTLGITLGAAAVASSNYDVSDQLGDLQRIMGLTADESDRLYDSLKKLDTRTSVSGLLNIANIAAKAGVAKEDIVGVTQAIDKLVVVLGKELGDADKVTESLVKISNIFSKDGKVTGESLTAIGNGILQLANAGVATGPFIVDYTQRLAGLAKTANLTLASALGLGAGFEELGQSSEVAGTATVQILLKMSQDVPKFAKIAGKSIEDFTKTLREKPAEALIQVAEALAKNKTGLDQLGPAFAEAETKGVRVMSTFMTLGGSADFFRGKIALAGKALGESSSINEQFEIKNNTLAGSIDKLKNAIVSLTTDPNSNLGKFFKSLIDAGTGAIKIVDKLLERMNGFSNQELTPEGLAGLSKAKTYGGLSQGRVLDTERFNQGLSEAIARAKQANDQYIKDFGQSTGKEQQIFLEAIEGDYAQAKTVIDKFRAERKTDTAEGIAANLNYIQLADKLVRARQTLLNANKPTNSGGDSGDILTKKEQKQQDKDALLQLKAETDRAKIRSQAEIDSQKDIADNDKNTLAERLAAAEKYYSLRNRQVENVANAEKKALDEQISQGKAVNEQKLLVDDQYTAEKVKNMKDLGKMTSGILKDNATDELKAITDALSFQQIAIEKRQLEETSQLNKLHSAGLITTEQYEAEKLRIENSYAIESLKAQIEATQKILDIKKLQGADITSEQLKLNELSNKLYDADLKYYQSVEEQKTAKTKEEAEKRATIEKQKQELLKEIFKASYDLLVTLAEADYTRQKNQVQEEIDQIDIKKQAEIDAVNNTTQAAEGKAAQIKIIEAKAQAQREALDRRQRQIDQQKAQFDKIKAIFEIGVQTAVNIVKVAPNPILMALAAALGAIQIGIVAAKPIPKYAKGTKDHQGGPLVAGDGGRSEVIVTPDGQIIKTPATDTMYDMPEHTRVFPSMEDFFKYASLAAFQPLPPVDSFGGAVMAKEIINGLGEYISNLNDTVKSKPVANITNYTKDGITRINEENNSFTKYVNKYMT